MERFVKAQEAMYDTALRELKQGEKESHWIWFIFPQLYGLGRSETAQFYGIRGRQEAMDYLSHPVLYPRLVTCCEALLMHSDKNAEDVMGWDVDALKLWSSMTLFACCSAPDSVFHQVLQAFYHGKQDPNTLALLQNEKESL